MSSSYAPLPSSPSHSPVPTSNRSTHARGHTRRQSSLASLASLGGKRAAGARWKLAVVGALLVLGLAGFVGVQKGRDALGSARDSEQAEVVEMVKVGGHTKEEEGIWRPYVPSTKGDEGEPGVDEDLSVSPAAQEDEEQEEAHEVQVEGEILDLDEEDSEEDEEGSDNGSAHPPCSDTVIRRISNPAFWVVRSTPSPFTYLISPSTPLVKGRARCLSHAVFSARLRSAQDVGLGEETIRSLPRPELVPHSVDYRLNLSGVVVPQGEYRVEVRLEYGMLEGAREAMICGVGRRSCDPTKEGARLGEEVRFVEGGLVRWEKEDEGIVEMGDQDLVEDAAVQLNNCRPDQLQRLEGYWSRSTFHPTLPAAAPCSLIDLSFPLAFLPLPPQDQQKKQPIWINFIGDSNTRNFAKLFIEALGNGPKMNAVVMDSPLKNGTVASIALRSRTGKQSYGDEVGVPDLIVTWSWWYQRAPTSPQNPVQWSNAITTNRDRLLFLANATSLLSWSEAISLSSVLGKRNSPLAKIAAQIKPSRTFISLGSHGEQLTAEGVTASLDFLLDEQEGINRQMRDAIGLRFFTTTEVATSAIPLDRFPHQDLTRNNVGIEGKNEALRLRSDVGGEGRVVDVEGLTRGISEGEGWMKVDKKGQTDAVHFVERVYREWARLVGTELMALVTDN